MKGGLARVDTILGEGSLGWDRRQRTASVVNSTPKSRPTTYYSSVALFFKFFFLVSS